MSKHNPNQIYYKTGGRSQSEGPDRGDALQPERQEFAEAEKRSHPAMKKAGKKK